jgi:hypothetical protein
MQNILHLGQLNQVFDLHSVFKIIMINQSVNQSIQNILYMNSRIQNILHSMRNMRGKTGSHWKLARTQNCRQSNPKYFAFENCLDESEFWFLYFSSWFLDRPRRNWGPLCAQTSVSPKCKISRFWFKSACANCAQASWLFLGAAPTNPKCFALDPALAPLPCNAGRRRCVNRPRNRKYSKCFAFNSLECKIFWIWWLG